MSDMVEEWEDDVHELDELGFGEEMPAVRKPSVRNEMARVNVDDIISVTVRLAQILAEEADLLEAMKVSQIAELQNEKRLLCNALEAMKKQVMKEPGLMDEMNESERENLREVITVFNSILDENYARLNMARAVNHKIVQAITEVAQEHSKNDVYDRKGAANGSTISSVSVTLNQKV